MADGTAHKLRKVRALDPSEEAPVFRLGGLAIGNGFTEAVEQTLVQVGVGVGVGVVEGFVGAWMLSLARAASKQLSVCVFCVCLCYLRA